MGHRVSTRGEADCFPCDGIIIHNRCVLFLQYRHIYLMRLQDVSERPVHPTDDTSIHVSLFDIATCSWVAVIAILSHA